LYSLKLNGIIDKSKLSGRIGRKATGPRKLESGVAEIMVIFTENIQPRPSRFGLFFILRQKLKGEWMGNYQEQRRHVRETCNINLEFTVLLTQSTEFRRLKATGKTLISHNSIVWFRFSPDRPFYIRMTNTRRTPAWLVLVKWLKIEAITGAGLITHDMVPNPSQLPII
jgi:hypothetical protein